MELSLMLVCMFVVFVSSVLYSVQFVVAAARSQGYIRSVPRCNALEMFGYGNYHSKLLMLPEAVLVVGASLL